MNRSLYKIHGIERKLLKKELSKLKTYIKNFWHFHQLDKDMASFYGGASNYPMSDEIATKKLNKAKEQVITIEKQLLWKK